MIDWARPSGPVSTSNQGHPTRSRPQKRRGNVPIRSPRRPRRSRRGAPIALRRHAPRSWRGYGRCGKQGRADGSAAVARGDGGSAGSGPLSVGYVSAPKGRQVSSYAASRAARSSRLENGRDRCDDPVALSHLSLSFPFERERRLRNLQDEAFCINEDRVIPQLRISILLLQS